MNAALHPSSVTHLPLLENPVSRLTLDKANATSRFSGHRAPTLISRPRLEDGLWRPLRLDLLKTPLTRYHE